MKLSKRPTKKNTKVKNLFKFARKIELFFYKERHFFDLEMCRITFFLLVFSTNLDARRYLVSDISNVFWAPQLLFQFFNWPISDSFLFVIEVIWLASLIFSALGIFSKLSMISAAVLGTFVFGLTQNFGSLYNDSMVTLLCLWVFCFSNAGQYISLDSLIRTNKTKKTSSSHVEHNWPIRAAQLLTSFAFFGAGLSKVITSGLTWGHPDNFSLILRKIDVSYARPFWETHTSYFLRTVLDSKLLTGIIGYIILYCELFALLAPFFKIVRLIVIPILFFMIVSNIHLMGLDFNRFIPVFTFWIPWSYLSKGVSE